MRVQQAMTRGFESVFDRSEHPWAAITVLFSVCLMLFGHIVSLAGTLGAEWLIPIGLTTGFAGFFTFIAGVFLYAALILFDRLRP